jgi:ATP-binding cassette, subfamily G (WHITE), member 2, SNQ2
MLVDGRPLGPEFQRGTGFCEQMDLHDGTATIREALEFSAVLRQDRNIPRAEKIAYVDKIIDLLELGDMQDALVRSLGVEQRKRKYHPILKVIFLMLPKVSKVLVTGVGSVSAQY